MTFEELAASGVTFLGLARFPGYMVGDDGSVWSSLSRKRLKVGVVWTLGVEWHRLKPGIRTDGHNYVALSVDGIKIQCSVHSLVLECFVSPRPLGYHGCHNDGDPSNNRVENVRWDTVRGNQRDRFRHGTDPTGERNGRAKLTEAKVEEIIRACNAGMTQTEAGRRYGIASNTVSALVRGQTWKHMLNQI